MPSKRRYLVAGLGNPGGEYKKTRHNAGFMALDEVAEAYSISVSKRRFNLVYGHGKIENVEVILAKPQSFMNRSGLPIYSLAGYYNILCKDMLVIHDDIDLTFGRIKIKEKGGHGGHKGLKSIIDTCGSGDFTRLRIGVGRSEAQSVTNHVLGQFRLEEKKNLEQVITRAREAVAIFFSQGLVECMNTFNQKIIISS